LWNVAPDFFAIGDGYFFALVAFDLDFVAVGVGATIVVGSSWTMLITNFRRPLLSKSITVYGCATSAIVPGP
jgi:hypothetical protein